MVCNNHIPSLPVQFHHQIKYLEEIADLYAQRFHERALNVRWKKGEGGPKRADKSNAIDMLCSGHLPESDMEKEEYEKNFEAVPTPFTARERKEWLSQLKSVVCSSDAFVRLLCPRYFFLP